MNDKNQGTENWLWVLEQLSEMMLELSNEEPDHDYVMKRYNNLHEYTSEWENYHDGNGVSGGTTLRATDSRGLYIQIEMTTTDQQIVPLDDLWNNLDI